MPNITISGWRALRKTFDIPVDADRASSFCPILAPATAITVLSKPIDEWIVNASRILYINAGTPPAIGTETDWQNILRWEASTFWEIDHARPFVETVYQRRGRYGHEHAKRSGEYLAMGAALTLLDVSGIASPAHVYFLNDTEARPDFVIALFTRSKVRVHVEARSRGSFTNISAEERKQINAKKGNVVGPTLVVYFQHGVDTCTPYKGMLPYNRTRLLLADPPGDDAMAGTDEVAATMLRNYLRVFLDVGLHHYSELVQEDLRQYTATGTLPARRTQRDPPRWDVTDYRHPNRKHYGQGTYVGRFFSSLLEELASSSRDAILSRIRRSEFGAFSYRGVNRDVLVRIQECRWDDLVTFRDPESTGEHSGATITSDGVVDDTTEVVEPDSLQARLIRESIG